MAPALEQPRKRTLLRRLLSRWTATVIAILLLAYQAGVPLPAPAKPDHPSGFGVYVERSDQRFSEFGTRPVRGVCIVYVTSTAWGATPPPGDAHVINDSCLWLPRFQQAEVDIGGVAYPAFKVVLPLLPLALGAVIVAAYLHGRARGGRFVSPNVCRKCGYPLTAAMAADGNVEECPCPECGAKNRRVRP